MEVPGNLISIGTGYANTRGRVTCGGARGAARFAIEDDGPGIDRGTESCVRQRGGWLDRTGAAGRGLAIVRDVPDDYGRGDGFPPLAARRPLRAHWTW